MVFGTLLFGRMQGGEGADRVMGPFINTLPVRIGVGEEGVEAAVRRTHALLADLLRHEHASLALAQRCSGVAAPAPLFTSLLNYRYSGGTGAFAARRGSRGRACGAFARQERTNYPVVLSVDDLGEAFSLTAQVAAPAEAERVCRMMHTALERLVEALEARSRAGDREHRRAAGGGAPHGGGGVEPHGAAVPARASASTSSSRRRRRARRTRWRWSGARSR